MDKVNLKKLLDKIKEDDQFLTKLVTSTAKTLREEGIDIEDEDIRNLLPPSMDTEMPDVDAARAILIREVKVIIEFDF